MKLFPALVVCLLALIPTHAQQSAAPVGSGRESARADAAHQTAQGLRERPVFMTAQRLATLCRDWLRFPIGDLDESATSYSVSPNQFVRAMGCISYLEGSADTMLQISSDDAPYKPKMVGNVPDARDTVGYFVRYMDKHVEDSELAAITVLRQCEIERAKK